MFGLSTTEMLIILAIVVVLFGARRIPKLARAVGDAVREFRASRHGTDTDHRLEG